MSLRPPFNFLPFRMAACKEGAGGDVWNVILFRKRSFRACSGNEDGRLSCPKTGRFAITEGEGQGGGTPLITRAIRLHLEDGFHRSVERAHAQLQGGLERFRYLNKGGAALSLSISGMRPAEYSIGFLSKEIFVRKPGSDDEQTSMLIPKVESMKIPTVEDIYFTIFSIARHFLMDAYNESYATSIFSLRQPNPPTTSRYTDGGCMKPLMSPSLLGDHSLKNFPSEHFCHFA
ncbi:hypothetical protein CEXT_654661 [Caerostris extrusa]|uniref:Uncharacterized protein n=1 Tax=Caerostris extrusa TaxID=172846 RepID=A0AAV4PJ46_CAEEX|nr:hypothetical protein CEXT_654661 [Caerostris extrusa]